MNTSSKARSNRSLLFTALALSSLAAAAAPLGGCSSAGESTRGAPPTSDPSPPAPPEPPAPAVCPPGEAFRLVSNKIVVDASIEGGPTQKWILDTGAPESVADTTISAQVARKTVKVTAGGVTRDLTMPVADVKAASRMNVVGVLAQADGRERLGVDDELEPRRRGAGTRSA